MRWNCPHCEELVTAGIDFESTTKAYVRCARCNGMALIHRSAVLADYVKARRMDEEAQLETEIRLQKELKQSRALQQSIEAQNLQVQSLQAQIQQATRDMETTRANAAILSSSDAAPPLRQMGAPPNEVNVDGRILSAPMPPPMKVAESTAAATETARATPPPFVQATIRIQEDLPAETPSRKMPVPPAFLVGNVEEAVRAFAIEEAQASEDIFFADAAKPSDAESRTPLAARFRSNLAVWIAAALALASGIYLYHEGKQALAPTIETRADP